MKSEVGSIQDQGSSLFLHNLSLYSTSRSLHLELKAPTELWDRISGSSNMAQRKWPSYAEWLVERSVYSLFCDVDSIRNQWEERIILIFSKCGIPRSRVKKPLYWTIFRSSYIIIRQACLPVQMNRWETAKLYGFDSIYDIIYSLQWDLLKNREYQQIIVKTKAQKH